MVPGLIFEPGKEGTRMRKLALGLLVVGFVVSLSACSARTQFALEETQKNGAHFATWRHMGYSINRGTPETTTKRDIERSQGDRCLPNQICKWWGEVVKVSPIQ
jgi:hypothetical protein